MAQSGNSKCCCMSTKRKTNNHWIELKTTSKLKQYRKRHTILSCDIIAMYVIILNIKHFHAVVFVLLVDMKQKYTSLSPSLFSWTT